MDWPLVRRGVARYALVGAGVVAVPAILLLGEPRAAIGLVAVGLLLVLSAFSGSSNADTNAAMANSGAEGLVSGATPVENTGRGPRWNALTAFFLAVGFLGWGVLAAALYPTG